MARPRPLHAALLLAPLYIKVLGVSPGRYVNGAPVVEVRLGWAASGR